MKSTTPLFLLLALSFASCQSTPQDGPQPLATIGSIEQYDARLADYVDLESPIRILSSGYNWTEGPLWVPDLDGVLFTDIPSNSIFIWTEADSVSLWLRPSGYTGEAPRAGEVGANGLALDADGRLILCQHGDRRIARLSAPLTDPTPSFETVADTWDGQRFNSPNDLTLHSDGSIYFTDPPYGLPQQTNDPERETPFQGVYRVSPTGVVTLLVDSLSRPNGIALSPDEQTLYVANSDPERAYWLAYEVAEDGSLSNGRILLDATPAVPNTKGLPDGLELAEDGTLFATGPSGVWIISPEGKHLGTLRTTEATSNVAFGGENRQTLFMTADMHLLAVDLNMAGLAQ